MTIQNHILGYFIVKPILNQQGFGSHYSTFHLRIVHKLPQKASGNETCILANSPCIDDFPIKTIKHPPFIEDFHLPPLRERRVPLIRLLAAVLITFSGSNCTVSTNPIRNRMMCVYSTYPHYSTWTLLFYPLNIIEMYYNVGKTAINHPPNHHI